MKLKVWNKETTLVETIEAKDLDTKIHFHRNTHAVLKKEDYITKVETKKEDSKKVETK